jgi:putative endonuclease
MKSTRQKLASWGEDLAAEFLKSQGYQIIDRNVRTPYGEIDLIARRTYQVQTTLQLSPFTLFVEVKTRSSTAYGYPEQAVTRKKRQHLLDSAQEYIRLHPELDGDWRVDVIAILRAPGNAPPQIHVFENAITSD